MVHLSEKEVNVTLIPVAENLPIDTEKIKAIYAKVGVKLTISTDKLFPVTETIDTKNAFGDLSTYSPEQQAIIAWYKSEREVKSDTYYVFVGKQEGSQAGYMRLGGQFGFVLDANERTIAHELGHGIFKLEHPFKKDETKKGTFRTLMDYAQETTFAYSDWKQINDPKLRIGFFEGQEDGEYKNYLNIPNSLRTLRMCQKYNIGLSVEKDNGGELPKSFSFFEYETEDKITLFYEKSGTLKNFSFTKDEKYSNFYNKQMYQVKIGNLGYFNCLSKKDRDVLYDFLTQKEFKYVTDNKIIIQKKKTYSYSLLYNDLEKIKADLIKSGKYKKLSENEKLLLDLPLIMWSKKWEYGSIFMYNWFMQEGDIEMDNDLYAFLDKWRELKSVKNDFLNFISKNKNKKINQEIKQGTFRLYALNDLKKYISNNQKNEFYFDRNFDTKYTNFSRYSVEVSGNDINNPYVASFGTLGVGFLLEGNYNRKKEEITITNIWEEINDRFDFEGRQVLGTWKNSIFKPFNTLGIRNFDPLDEILNIDNGNFRDFRHKTGLGKDYKIKGKRVYKNKFIEKIKINNNEIQYQ